MRHLMHRRGVLISVLLAALLAGSVAAADVAAAAPKDKDAHPAKSKTSHGHGHVTSPAPGREPGAPAKPHTHQRRAAPAGPTAVALPLPPAAVPFKVAVPPAAVLRQERPRAAPFQPTARPFRPLVRPSVVPETTARWQWHEPADRPVLRALRSTANDPTTPLLVAALVGLFLLVQHRIDRHDPKLSLAHRHNPTDLRFGPVMAL